MAIPEINSILLSLLKLSQDQKEHSLEKYLKHIHEKFGLTSKEKSKTIKDGKQPIIECRVAYSASYLERCGLIKKTKTNHAIITDFGLKVAKLDPQDLERSYLSQFSEFVEIENNISKKSDKGHFDYSKSYPELLEDTFRMFAYNDEFGKDIKQLDNSAVGAYIGMITECFFNGYIKDDEILRIAKCSIADWEKIKPMIENKFSISDGKWIPNFDIRKQKSGSMSYMKMSMITKNLEKLFGKGSIAV